MSAEDYLWRFPNRQTLIDFTNTGSYTITGATPSTVTDALIPGITGSRKQGVGSNVVAKTFSPTVDLTDKGLVLVANWSGTAQLQYLVSSLANDTTFNGTPRDVVLQTDPGLPSTGSMTLGDSNGVMYWRGRTGLTLKNVVLGKAYDSTGLVIKTATGSYTAGTRCTLFDDGFATPVSSFQIRLAASAAAHTAGNYIVHKLPQRQWYGWMLSSFLPQAIGTMNGTGTIKGTGCDLSNVGYIRINVNIQDIPFSGPIYNGPQPSGPTPFVKWHALQSFDHVPSPFISFTYDDAHDSDLNVVAVEMRKPRPGFPGGMRCTFHVLDYPNIATNAFATFDQYQKASADGFEIACHAQNQHSHANQKNVIFEEEPEYAGIGTPLHFQVAMAGGGVTDLLAQQRWIRDVIGVPGGPLTWAFPHGVESGAAIDDALKQAGFVAYRALSGGMSTNPVGDVWRSPGEGGDRDLVTDLDLQGHHITMDQILFACQNGMRFTTVMHAVAAGTGIPSGPGGWNQNQLSEVLDYLSDLKMGTNLGGNNPDHDHFPDLQVGPLSEQITGVPTARAPRELVGAGF